MKILIPFLLVSSLSFTQIFEKYQVEQGMLLNSAISLDVDSQNNIWMIIKEMGGGGVSKFDGTSFTNHEFVNSLDICQLSSIKIDKNNVAWAAGLNTLLKQNGSSWDTIDLQTYYNTASIEDIDFDSENNLWIANNYYYGRLMNYDGTDYNVVYDNVDSSFNQNLYSVHVQNDNAVWFSIAGFIGKYDGANSTFYGLNEGMQLYGVHQIISTSEGNIWAVGYNGVGFYDGTSWTCTIDDFNIPTNAKTIAVDEINDRVFVGGFGSYSVYEGNTWTKHYLNDGDGLSVAVNDIVIDHNNVKWFGTSDGLYKLLENVGIQEHAQDELFVYPNPFSDHLNINLKENQNWILEDINGKQICAGKNQEQLKEIEKGVYFMNIYENGQFITTRKIVKI